MIPVFWRYLRMPSRILLSTLFVLLAAVLIFAIPPGVQGQAGLSGVVSDPSGDAVANKGTSQAHEEKTGTDGVYKFRCLPAMIALSLLRPATRPPASSRSPKTSSGRQISTRPSPTNRPRQLRLPPTR